MDNNLAEQHIVYQGNVVPVLLDKLAEQLKVSTSALTTLEIGYALRVPLKNDRNFYNCWVFPERDERGSIIGLSLRQWDGQKRMVPGSKRGLTYVADVHESPVEGRYQAGPQNFERSTEDTPCPICGRAGDGCLISSEDTDDPKAVICCRTSEGAVKSLGAAGHLYIRKEEGYLKTAGSVLPLSDYPVVIVEGASDVAAAWDIGLTAIGRPSSAGCLSLIPPLIAGRSVVVLGENDAGAGKEGMEQTFEILRPHAKQIVKVMPPEGVKDLRQWAEQGLARDQFVEYARSEGSTESTNIILASIAPLDLAKQWLEVEYYENGIYTLRKLHGVWYAYNGRCYEEVEAAHIRKQLYRYFGDKKQMKMRSNGYDLINYDPTKGKVDQIMDALLAYCPIAAEEIPCWLSEDHEGVNPKHMLTFPNGRLNVTDCMRGGVHLERTTPDLFTLSSYPYDFDSNATCNLWKEFLAEIFADDPIKIRLLQEWFGYNLIPDNSHEKFMLFLGPTRAGKGTILDVLTNILGEDQVLATTFKDYTRRFGLYPFLGKLAAVMGDVSVGENYDATEALNVLKRITGNDVITIERKGQDITQTCIRLYARFTMAANVMPRLPDYSRTVEARILLIQFLISYMGREDITLKTRLRTESPGILLWALDGLKRLQQTEEFSVPIGTEGIMRRIRGHITPFVEFIDECCLLGDTREYYITHEMMYDCWRNWANRNGERPQTTRWVNRSVMSLYAGCQSGRMTLHSGRKRVFKGIKLRDSAMIEYLGIAP